MTTPRYVTRDNEQAFAPPYRQDGCALHAFALPAARARLQRVVDRFLAEPTGGRLRPRVAADHVLLYFCEFARSQSHDPDDARRGWLGERECGLWIPLQFDGAAVPSFFTHLMIVDSGPAMCSGREVLGFPKEIGAVHVSRERRCPTLAVDVLAMGGGRSRPGCWRPLIELERLEPGPPHDGPGVELARWTELLGVAEPGSAGQLGRALAAIARAGRGRVDFLNLKQFRDCADPARACYQAVVRASAALRGVRRIAGAGPYAYRIHDHASHPLVEQLGLPAEGRARGVFCEFDFDFEAGEAL
jgi:hypothetical protein